MPALTARTPFTGRGRELAAILERLAAARAGAGGVVLLAGEAGIGKSRLATEVAAHAAQQGVLLLQGSCFETDRALPYAPVVDLLRGLLGGRAPDDVAGVLGPAAPELFTLLPELARQLPGVAPPPAADPEQEKRRLFHALSQVVTGLAAAQPLLLVLEDAHWSDETSLEWLLYLARRLPAQPVLGLLTYRSDEAHPTLAHVLAELERARLAIEVPLRPLSPDEVGAMLRAIFAQERPVRAEFLEAVYGLSEGNPFFIEEVLKSLVAAGDIFYAGGQWDRKPLGALRIPRTVEDAVRRRVERLSEAARDSLALAAVAGRRFDYALLLALTGLDERALLDQIKELIAAQLVVEESAERVAFRHALTRRAVSAGLLARERRALHGRVAAAMERLYAAKPDAHLTDLAYHFHEAEAWEQALAYGRAAGERAQSLHAPRAAAEHFTRALDAARALALSAPELLRARGLAYETLGEFEPARADLEAAHAAARAAGDRRAVWQALVDLGFLWTSRDYATAGGHFRGALAVARELGDPAAVARSLNRVGNWYLNAGRPAEALRHHEEALAAFDGLGDRRGVAETLDLLGMVALHYGDAPQGVAHYGRAVPLLRELDDRRGLVSSLAILAQLGAEVPALVYALPAVGIAEAIGRGEEAVAIAREIGWRAGEAYALQGLATCLAAVGEYGRALELTRAGLAVAEEIEHRQWMLVARVSFGALCFDLLALPAARRHLERALAEAREIGSVWFARSAAILLAWTCLEQGDLARAEAVLDAESGPDGPAQSAQERGCWLVRAELALARGEPARALAIADHLVAAANRPAAAVIPVLWLARGRALAALERPAEAEAALRAAQEALQAKGFRPLLWRVRAALGSLSIPWAPRRRGARVRRRAGARRGAGSDSAGRAHPRTRPGLAARAVPPGHRRAPARPPPHHAAARRQGALRRADRARARGGGAGRAGQVQPRDRRGARRRGDDRREPREQRPRQAGLHLAGAGGRLGGREGPADSSRVGPTPIHPLLRPALARLLPHRAPGISPPPSRKHPGFPGRDVPACLP